jgi:predicted outer membrane repeat protein
MDLVGTRSKRGKQMKTRPRTAALFGKIVRPLSLVAAVCAATSATAGATTFFVNSHAAPGGDGLSWSTAFKSLDDAFAAVAANPGADEIRVAEGRYRPTVRTTATDPRSVTFKIPHNTTLRGGFLGTELGLPALGQPRKTILSGDIGVLGDPSDNAYHVVSAISVNGTVTAAIDGFTIRDGHADTGDVRGGGLFVNGGFVGLNFTISHCIVRDNWAGDAGGMFYQSAHVRMWKCKFEHNYASNRGGALRAQAAYMRCDMSSFLSNTSVNGGGAVVIAGNPDPSSVFVNCLFAKNESLAGGGGAVFMGSGQYTSGSGMWINCTFAENTSSGTGSAIYAGPTATIPAIAIVRNCVAWNNTPAASPLANAYEVSYSDVEGGWPGTGNVNADPYLTADYTLSAGSPAIDSGSNALMLLDALDLDADGVTAEPVPFDLAGHARQIDDPSTPDTGAGVAPIVDMGAFEHG